MIDKGKNDVASNQTRFRTFVSSTVLYGIYIVSVLLYIHLFCTTWKK